MPWRPRRPGLSASAREAALAAPLAAVPRTAGDSLVRLVGRLLVAQAGACAAIGLGYSRRNLPWVTLAVVVAVALCLLAVVVKSGSHAAWLAAVSAEVVLVAVGLFRFGYARYLGGTLLGIITLGTLLRPAVARAFAGQASVSGPAGATAPVVGEPGPDVLHEPVAG